MLVTGTNFRLGLDKRLVEAIRVDVRGAVVPEKVFFPKSQIVSNYAVTISTPKYVVVALLCLLFWML
jgi:hypothetical protein